MHDMSSLQARTACHCIALILFQHARHDALPWRIILKPLHMCGTRQSNSRCDDTHNTHTQHLNNREATDFVHAQCHTLRNCQLYSVICCSAVKHRRTRRCTVHNASCTVANHYLVLRFQLAVSCGSSRCIACLHELITNSLRGSLLCMGSSTLAASVST
jgi:hypothetical protein